MIFLAIVSSHMDREVPLLCLYWIHNSRMFYSFSYLDSAQILKNTRCRNYLPLLLPRLPLPLPLPLLPPLPLLNIGCFDLLKLQNGQCKIMYIVANPPVMRELMMSSHFMQPLCSVSPPSSGVSFLLKWTSNKNDAHSSQHSSVTLISAVTLATQ